MIFAIYPIVKDRMTNTQSSWEALGFTIILTLGLLFIGTSDSLDFKNLKAFFKKLLKKK